MQWPSQSLRTQTLIDTPGIASLSSDTSARAGAFLAPDDAPSQADAVVYLMRHLHATDVRFLESFYDQGVARATPINTIAVLSRADEIGVGRLDALNSARRIARRYRADDKIRGLCQTVVAVAGLLAQTGRTMRQQEFAALTALAALPRTELDGMLLSVDRFVRVESGLDPDARARLIDRFGLFGVRLGATLIRQGVTDPSALAAELVRRSGLDDLRSLLTTQFAERRDLLKARSALLAVDLVLTREPRPAAAPLAAEVERILAGAHEFAELRLLATIRAGVVKLPPDALDGGGAAARRRRRRPGGPAGARPGRGARRAVSAPRWTRRAGGSDGRRARCPAARCPTSPAWSCGAAKASWPTSPADGQRLRRGSRGRRRGGRGGRADVRPFVGEDAVDHRVAEGAVLAAQVAAQHPLAAGAELGDRRLRVRVQRVGLDLDAPEAAVVEAVRQQEELGLRVDRRAPPPSAVQRGAEVDALVREVDLEQRRGAHQPAVHEPDRVDDAPRYQEPRRHQRAAVLDRHRTAVHDVAVRVHLRVAEQRVELVDRVVTQELQPHPGTDERPTVRPRAHSDTPTICRRCANSSPRLPEPSRCRIRATWCSTVFAEMNSRSPICL